MDRCIETRGSLVAQLDQPTLNWIDAYTRAKRAQIAGDTDRAEQLAAEAFQIGTDGGQPDATTIFRAQFLNVSVQRGTLADLIPLIEQAVSDNPTLPAFTAVLASAHAEAGRTDDARHLLEKFAAADFDLPQDQVWTTGMVSYAGAAIECRDLKYAEPLFDRLVPWPDQWSTAGGASAQGPVSHFLGGLATVLGRYDEADAYFAQARASSDRAGAKFFAARTDLMWGRMLAERHAVTDINKARKLLNKAHSAAKACGYGYVERRAAAALELLDA